MPRQHASVRDQPLATGSPEGREPSLLMLGAITCLSLEAALIHLWFTTEHWMAWWGYGFFFVACAIGQAVYGPLLLWRRDSVALLHAGIWANTGVVALYVVTRIWGIPLGPHAQVVESVGLPDLTSVVSELLLVVLLVRLLPARHRRSTVNLLMIVGLLLWALRLGVGTVL
jgi:hypothetical protein